MTSGEVLYGFSFLKLWRSMRQKPLIYAISPSQKFYILKMLQNKLTLLNDYLTCTVGIFLELLISRLKPVWGL